MGIAVPRPLYAYWLVTWLVVTPLTLLVRPPAGYIVLHLRRGIQFARIMTMVPTHPLVHFYAR